MWRGLTLPPVRGPALTRPQDFGPPKTRYNRWKQWSRTGVFAMIMTELAAQTLQTEIVTIDVEPVVRHWSENHWRGRAKARRTASSLGLQKGGADA